MLEIENKIKKSKTSNLLLSVSKSLIVAQSLLRQKIFFKTIFSKKGWKLISKFFIKLYCIVLNIETIEHKNFNSYQDWVKKNMPTKNDFEDFQKNLTRLTFQPKISIIMPVYNTSKDYLTQAIQSVRNQIYPNWELCIADDASSLTETLETLKYFENEDSRIKIVYRRSNGHISDCSNSALELTTGMYTALFDHDDLLTKDALYQMVVVLNNNRALDFIYSDEDKTIDGNTFLEPTFKPSWSPDNLLSRNYIGHLTLIKTALINEVGGFRKKFNGSQDYDLYLRITEKTNAIYHLPLVLYHWRMHEKSVAANTYSKPYAYIAGKIAIEEALERRNIEASVKMLEEEMLGFYSINYALKGNPKISILIPSKNQADLLEQCLSSIFNLSTYPNFEIIIIDNGSDEPKFFEVISKYKNNYSGKFFSYNHNIPFNFSALINFGVTKSTGEYLILLNNDTKIITKNWMEKMIVHGQQTSTGVVGVKLLFPNNTIQHAGVLIDNMGYAKHIFSGKKNNESSITVNAINNYPAVTAACFLVKKELYLKIGGFDEDFAVEYNDIDYCLKTKKAGYEIVYLPDVELYHYESISRGHADLDSKKYKQFLTEYKRFNNKWSTYIIQNYSENKYFINYNL